MNVSVVLLAAGEAENLRILIPRILSVLQDTVSEFEILVVDLASPVDNSAKICAEYPAVQYIRQEEPCYAGAFRTGIRFASKDYLLVLDADGSHPPEKIAELIKKSRDGYDLVIGSRYCKGGKTKDSIISFVMSKILNAVMRVIVGVKAKDISTSFRIYKTEQLKNISLTCRNYEVLQEVLLRMKKINKDFSIAEVPITFEKRISGRSKRKLLRFIATYIRTLFRFLRIRFTK